MKIFNGINTNLEIFTILLKMGKRAGKLQTAVVVVKETTTAHAVLNTCSPLNFC